MDGIHDLGGRDGFGPVDVSHEYEGFHAEWEARVFAVVRSMARPHDWSLDWFRHCRELIDPVDYLSRPYYDQWLQSYAAMLINSGVATLEEVVSGDSGGMPDMPLSATVTAADVPRYTRTSQTFDGDAGKSPAFVVGQRVKTLPHGIKGHTRMPAYVRGCTGTVSHYRGDHVMPDDNARGTKRVEALYTVVFAAGDLWSDAESPEDLVHVDLWESYLQCDD